jgi:phytoene desaturase
MKHAVVVGAGFGGLSAAGYLRKSGYKVTVLEKNSWVGGRARVLRRDGFRFDMGPSWYWMPEQHDRWFADMGSSREEHYPMDRVDPSYRVYFGSIVDDEQRNVVDVPADFEGAKRVFESYEPGAGRRLEEFVRQGRRKFEFAVDHFIYKNYRTIFDMANATTLKNLSTLNLFSSYRSMIDSYFTHPYLKRILEFPVVFLGSFAGSTPAVYTLMNYIDFGLGTWYPRGGFGQVVSAMRAVDEELGVRFQFDSEVTGFDIEEGTVRAVIVGDSTRLEADVVVVNADYPHVELNLLPKRWRSIPENRWTRKSLAPAVLNYYIGFTKKLDGFSHHTFFFDADWNSHFRDVYQHPRWPEEPLFYLHIPSITDPTCAPDGYEAVFLLIPIAPGLEDTQRTRHRYLELALDRMEERSGERLRDSIHFAESYSINDFKRDYNAYKGTAFGLGQTLLQTAYFRPGNRSSKVRNLYYAGHYTIPGTGTTMSMISGKVVTDRIREEHGRG